MTIILDASPLAACNTLESVGQDLERGGEEVQDASRTLKH